MKLSRLEKLEKIVHLNTLMNQTHEFDKLLTIILRETESMFSVEGTAIFLEDEDTGLLYFYIVTGEKKEALTSIRMKKDEGVCGHVFVTGESMIENHPENSPYFCDKADKESDFHTRNILAEPLQIKNKTFGVIEVVNKIKGDFTEDDRAFLEVIASQVSVTLERARFVQEKIKQEKLASIGETVAGLAHYIKNILNGIKGGAYIIDKNIKGINAEKVKLGWDMVKNNVKRITELTLDMLRYTKEREPEYEEVDLHKLIEEVLALLKEKLQEKNICLKKKFSKEIKLVDIDPKGIHRCILNLISNSIDALEEEDSPQIILKTIKKDENFVIKIKDNGCGIKEEIQKRLFTKFLSTKGSKGTGFGLPITKKIIEEHKGSIKVKSKVNVGSEFKLTIPIKKENKQKE